MSEKKDNKHQLKTITPEQLNEAYKKQLCNQEWNFFNERKHVEELLCQRFNYLILAFSLFTTAFASIEGRNNKIVVLATGLVVLLLISLTIRRAYLKLDINLKILHKLQKANDTNSSENRETGYNAMAIVDKEIQERCCPMKNMNKAIGVWIPLVFILIFSLGIVAIATGYWTV